jgi:hypothetical protein
MLCTVGEVRQFQMHGRCSRSVLNWAIGKSIHMGCKFNAGYNTRVYTWAASLMQVTSTVYNVLHLTNSLAGHALSPACNH